MGRRPNALILQYFERGPKLQDQSNRYPHTCRSCGEHFPRGRLDSLTSHLTKKCPAISEAERVNALLTLSGMSHASQRFQQSQQAQAQAQAQARAQANGSPVDLPMIQRDWTALGVLAEVSRQIDLNEKNDDRGQPNGTAPPAPAPPGSQPTDRFDLQEQFTLENPPTDQENGTSKTAKAEPSSPEGDRTLTAEERLQEILRADDANSTNADSANLSMAAAATARLHPEYLDPEILGEEAAAAADAATASAAAAAAVAAATNSLPMADMDIAEEPAAVPATPAIPTSNAPQPWGELTYATDSFQATVPNNSAVAPVTPTTPLAKGGFRLETAGSNGAKSRHSRARFNATRRKEVQEVRKIGACIRCRVLRKTCSQGSPCDTCRKVLSPRVWRSGCVRTKFSEQLDLYSAGVQIVLAQARVNSLKQTMTLGNHGVLVEACHFPECASRLQLQVLQRDPDRDAEGKLVDSSIMDDRPSSYPIIMLDNDNQDVPARVETYMREVLPELIRREPSHFMQVTLQTAVDVAGKTNDELLKKSLELWGLVEILDRERQWTINAKTWADDAPARSIKEDTDGELFNTVCLQLAAAAERKAAATSKALLTGMQRVLQDSKVKIDFNMYFAVLILLNCVEKSSWAFKAWEQENLRNLWPLEKEPVSFAQQGYVIANLLHMLLGIRKALPRTARREADGKLVTEEDNPGMREYFEAIDLDFAQVKAKQERPAFSPTDSRSFELLFCSTLLLPNSD
ncbi:Zn(2)-C6 fungal-type domain-containing protein [Madurella fahalii]|uniref:Zn(2)-C6 fungal-type domain-containing protein n=1 Tax=Madurella fahalii TaxID=1157608 RepID=A0ABQ0GML8_9PEZI